MPYKVYKRDGRYRLCDPDTKRIAKNPSGTAIDGGGHASPEKAQRQARAIMRSERR